MFIRIYKLCLGILIVIFYGCIENSGAKTELEKETLLLDSIALLYHRGDFDKSIELCKRFTTTYPSNDKAWHLLSSSYLGIENDSLSEIFANKALKINPKNYIALTNKGILLNRKGKYYEAAVFFEESLNINDSLAQTYSNYMLNRIRVADYGNAVKMGEYSLRYENNIWDKANLCFAYHKVGNITKRDSLLKELKKLDFENLESLELVISQDSE